VLRFLKVLFAIIVVVVGVTSAYTFYQFKQLKRVYGQGQEALDLPMFLPLKVIRLPLRDGTVLEGWFLRQEEPRPLIWIVPDIDEFHTDWFPWVSTLYDWGYSVVLFNHRGHRPSEGVFTADRRLLNDMRDVADHLENLAGIERRWGILAHGLGARFALEALCSGPPVRLLILEDPTQAYSEHLMMAIDRRWKIGLEKIKFWWRWHYRLFYRSPDIHEGLGACYRNYGQDRPHTVILQSALTPGFYVRHVYDKLGEPKEMIPVPLPATRSLGEYEQQRYRKLLKTMLDQYLPVEDNRITVGRF